MWFKKKNDKKKNIKVENVVYIIGASILGFMLFKLIKPKFIMQPPRPVSEGWTEFDIDELSHANVEPLLDPLSNKGEEMLTKVRGEAATLIKEAETYRERVVNMAKGDAARFNSIYEEYKKSPEITKKRMLIDKWDGKFPEYCDGSGGSGVVPYLPLPEVKK
jgi:modulator of FtsH protease HflK